MTKHIKRNFSRNDLDMLNACYNIMKFCEVLNKKEVQEKNKKMYFTIMQDYLPLNNKALRSSNSYIQAKAFQARKMVKQCEYIVEAQEEVNKLEK